MLIHSENGAGPRARSTRPQPYGTRTHIATIRAMSLSIEELIPIIRESAKIHEDELRRQRMDIQKKMTGNRFLGHQQEMLMRIHRHRVSMRVLRDHWELIEANTLEIAMTLLEDGWEGDAVQLVQAAHNLAH